MTGEIEPEGLALPFQPHLVRPVRHVGKRLLDVVNLFGEHAEHVDLPHRLRLGVLLGGTHRLLQGRHQGGAVGAEPIHGAGEDQLLHHPLVELLDVDPVAEVEQIAERAVPIPRVQNRVDGAFTNPLHRADTVDDVTVFVDAEAIAAGVHVRRDHGQPHPLALVHQGHDLVGVVHIGGHDRRHELGREVGLEPEGLVGDQRIGGGVRLVEAVARKLLHQIEDLHRQFAVDAILDGALFETGSLLGHLLGLFLTHRPAQHVRATERVTRQRLGNLHHLLLIEDDAVGGFEDGLEALVLPLLIRVGDRFITVFTVDEVIHHA